MARCIVTPLSTNCNNPMYPLSKVDEKSEFKNNIVNHPTFWHDIVKIPSKVICSGSKPRNCPQFEGVFSYMKNWYSHYLICLACPYKRRFLKVRWWMWPSGFRLVRQWWRLCCWNHRGFPGWVVSHKKLFAEIFYVLGQEELAEPETYYGYCAKLIRWHHLATKQMLPQTRLTKAGC